MKRYKINAIVIIPTVIITFMCGFAWGAKTEKDIQKVADIIPGHSVEIAPIATATPVITPTATHKPIPVPTLKGEIYRVTAYCPCVKCCGKSDGITASGNKAKEGITIAADWEVLPNGTEVEIKGIGTRIVQDRGGAIKGRRIDIFMADHKTALEFGVQEVEVIVKRISK